MSLNEHALINRTIVLANAANTYRALTNKTVKATSVELFWQQLATVLKSSKFSSHVPNYSIKHPDFVYIKKAHEQADIIHEQYDFPDVAETYMLYAKMAVMLMGHKYQAKKLYTLRIKIIEHIMAQLTVKHDTDREATMNFMTIFAKQCSAISKGFRQEDLFQYMNYANFVYARLEAEEAQADYHAWCAAQIAGLKFTGRVPALYQLYGEGAKERWRVSNTQINKKYMDMEANKFLNTLKSYNENLYK